MTPEDAYAAGERAAYRRIIDALRRDASTAGPALRPKLLEHARRFASMLDGPITMVECPAARCEAGNIVTRTPETIGTSYSVRQVRCEFCGGLGMVSPSKAAAYDGRRK